MTPRWRQSIVLMLIMSMVSFMFIGFSPTHAASHIPPTEPDTASAQDQLIDPPVAEALGENWRTLSEDEAHWYTFQHRGDNLPVHIWMDIEPNEGAGFHVFSEDEAQAVMEGALDPFEADAIGRGTRNPVEPGYLFWRGTPENPGLYYVMIEHGWTGDVQYTIYAAGPGLAR